MASRDHRAEITALNTRPVILELVQRYYPARLAALVLACCQRQQKRNYSRCCRHPLCPACCPRESHTTAAKQYRAFEACTPKGKPVRLAHEVYTLPPYLRPRVASKEGLRAWRQAVQATVREVHGAPVAGVLNLHPLGDEDLTKWHPHWDVVLNGYLLTPGGRLVQHRPPYVDYDDARRIYTRHLVHAFRLRKEETPEIVNLWLDRKYGVFRFARRKTWHMVRYSARHVYQPQFAWHQPATPETDWWYKPHAHEDPGKFPGSVVIVNLLAQLAWLRGRQRHVWFGYMTGQARRRIRRDEGGLP